MFFSALHDGVLFLSFGYCISPDLLIYQQSSFCVLLMCSTTLTVLVMHGTAEYGYDTMPSVSQRGLVHKQRSGSSFKPFLTCFNSI